MRVRQGAILYQNISNALHRQPWVIEEDEALPLLKAAYDRGLNTWDTANAYSNGESEVIIGKAIKKYDIPREKLIILTKCYFAVGETPGARGIIHGNKIYTSKDYVNRGGLSRSAIIKSVDASLKRLGTDYIDLLQIHRWDPETPPEETMEALHDLVKSGKVHYIGASSMWAYQVSRLIVPNRHIALQFNELTCMRQLAQLQFVAEKNGWTKFISMQNHYNLLYREEEREMNKFCHETGVGLIPVSTRPFPL